MGKIKQFSDKVIKKIKYRNLEEEHLDEENSEEIKLLSDDVYEQIKDFYRYSLTEEQESLIDKLISDEELKQYYKEYGLCDDCKQPNTYSGWCRICNTKRFQQNFKNWTSRNNDVDEFFQKTQLKAKNKWEILEWIE